MDKFSIILPNEKKGTYKILTFLIAIINITAFVFFSTRISEDNGFGILSRIGFSVVAIPLILYLLQKKEREANIFQMVLAFFFASMIWMIIGFYLMGFLLFIFALTGFFALRKLKIEFNTQQITYPSIPRKNISWGEVSNLILKDNILTLDLKNNKLIQYTLNESENEGLDETAFNTFVQQQTKNSSQL